MRRISRSISYIILIFVLFGCEKNFETERNELKNEFNNYIELTNFGEFEQVVNYLPSDLYTEDAKMEESTYMKSFVSKPAMLEFKMNSEFNIDTIMSEGTSIFSRISYSSFMLGDMSSFQDATMSLDKIFQQVENDRKFFGEENVDFDEEKLITKVTLYDFLYARKNNEGVWSIFGKNDLTERIIPEEIVKLPISY